MIFQNNFGKESQQAALALIELGTMYKIQCKFEEATHDLVEAKNILTHHFPHSPSDSNHSPQGSFAPSARGFPVTTAPVATSNDSTGLPPTGGDGDDVNADTTQSLPVADILKKLASINVSMKNSDLALKQYEEAIEIMQLNLGPDHLDIAEVLLDIGDLLRNDQFYDEAIDSYCEALQIQRQSLGSESIEVAQTLHTLGDIYKRTAQFVDAKKRYEECLNIRRLVLGDYHVDVALGYHNLAALLDRMGDLEGAEKNFKIALELRREVLGPTHPDVAQTLNNLAAILDDLNRPNDAEPLYREALTIYKDIFGDDHPDVALSLNNLGALLDDKGEYSKALPLYEEALSITRNIYGEESLEVASALVCLANALQHLKRYDEAEKLFERILAMKVKHFGEKSLEVAMIKYLYAELFLLQGEVSDAKELLEEVVAIRSSLLGVNHSSVSAILDKISEIDYQSQSAAQSQCQQQNPNQLAADLEIKQAQVGKDHISVAGDLIVLGSSLFDDQEYEKALERYQEGLVIYRREYGDVNVITVETIDMIIGCLQKLDRYEEAEKLCLESIETKKTLFDPEAYQVGDAIHTLASLYDKQRMDTQAIEKYKECLKIQRKTYGKYDPLIAQTLNNLAAILDDLGQPEEAEPYYKEALEIYRHAYGSHHPDVALSLNNLAALLDDRGCYEEAKDLYQEALGITRVVFGDSSPEVASAVICLASVLKRLKLYSEAERYYDEALKLKIALTGLDTTLECASLHDQIGAMCQLQKKFKEAKLSFEKGLEIRVFQHGNDHLDIAQSLEKLASLSEESGNYNDALNYLQRALNLRVKHYGHRTSPDVANVLVMLANINKKVRKFNESMQHYTEALGIYKGCNGSVHETVAETLCSMASLKRSTHHYEEAISLYDKAIAIYKSLQTHPSKVAQILGSIGAVYEKRKMLDEALIRYEAALSLQKEIYGGEIHSEVANSMTNMAVILKNQKNYSLSHLYYQKSLEIRKALYGSNHPDVAQSMNNLAALLYIEKKYDMARKLYEDSLAILTELYGHDNLDVAQALNNLAALLFAEKRFHESNKLYEESLNIRMKHLGRNHLDVASSLCNLGILKRSTHEYQEATRYFRDSLDIRLHLLRDESHNDVQVCRKHLAYVEQMSCPITVGMVVTYTDKGTGKKYKAVVTKKHSNGTYDVKYSPTNQRGSDENDVSAMTATETYVGRHRLAVSPSSDASSTTSLSGASDNASVERKTKEKHRQGHVQQFPPQPPPPPPHRDAFADPTKSTVPPPPPPPPPPPRDKRQSFLPTSPSKRNDNSSEFSDDMSAGDTAAVLTTSPTKAPVSSEEESTHVHSAIGISLEKEKHKPTLHSKSSRNLLLPPPNEVGTLKIPMKSLSRGMSRAQQLNQYSRQQSSAVAAAEAEASQYKSNVGSAGFRMSNKSFRLKKLASGLGSSEESDEDDSDFFSPMKQKQFDHSETTSVVSGFADYHHHERPDSRPERPGRGERLSDAVGSPFKKGGGVVVPTNRGSEFAASSGGGVDGPPSSRRR
jgi:tetratricopeptide (TPR) repeat protein